VLELTSALNELNEALPADLRLAPLVVLLE
jgi:hypothetical protein